MRKTLPAEIAEIIADWAREWPRIDRVYVYGSRARGWSNKWMRPPTPESDLDIAVVITDHDRDTATGFFMCKKTDMIASLQPRVPWPVDLQRVDPTHEIVTPERMEEECAKRIYERSTGNDL